MNRFRTLTTLLVTLVVVANLCLSATAAEKRAKIGDEVSKLNFKDVWYLPRSLDDFGEKKAYVISFTTLDCPQAEHYLPVLKRLDEKYREQGVQFLGVNVGPKDSIRQVAAQALAHELAFPVVKDFDGSCAEAVGVNATTSVVVLDGDRRLRYRGRIDDAFAVSGKPAEPTGRDLDAAVQAVLAGIDPAVTETPVVGTPISFDVEPSIGDDVKVTYAEHIAPLVMKHCQDCHKPETEAPFSLLTYQDVVDHAEMISEVVAEERMPPWFASFGRFQNERHVSAGEKELLTRWMADGMPEGDMSKLPEARIEEPKPGGWAIDEPDLVISMKRPHKLPADGYVPYKYVFLPYRFPHDTWIQQGEILPDNPNVVHHCNMAYIDSSGDWTDAKFVLGKVPGVQPMKFTDNVGFKIPKNSVLILQIHYTTTGQKEQCKISVGFRFAREVINKEFHFLWMINDEFAIPPGASAHRVSATNSIATDAIGVGLFAHMHLRGKDMSFFAHYPDGTKEKLLVIPNYSFDWQMAYRWAEPKRFPKGTQIEAVSHYDNSPFNPYNPDPKAEVREGQQTFHEMLNGVFFYLAEDEHLNLHIDPKTGAVIDSGEGKDAAEGD